jgi:hypothetical protein
MNREQKISDIARRAPHRGSSTRILIVSQGTVTEPTYFDGLKDQENIGNYSVQVIQKALDPIKLVQHALKIPSYPKNDMVWVLFDKDDFDDEQIEQAIRLSKNDPKIICAYSNPCFDLWLLLHEQNVTHAIGRKDIYAQLKSKHPKYNERSHKVVLYKDVKHGVDNAINRARLLEKMHVNEGTKPPPSTCVWRLVSMLLSRDHECACPAGRRSCIAY